jgi:small subunit ribosomal protein S7
MRKARIQPREVNPDPKYGDLVLAKFMNALMYDGRKAVAEKIVYSALDMLSKNFKLKDGEIIAKFNECVDKVKPSLEVRARRIGGATYQVPTDVRASRKQALAIRWIIEASRARKDKTMDEKLYKEFADILNDAGNAVKKRADVHKMAEANKAFAHFRW